MRHEFLLASLLLTPLAAGQGIATFPVAPSANATYLQDANGMPFPILGRTAWFITSLTQADYQTFLDDTAAKGYTAIEFHVINHDSRGNNEPYAGNGALPFLRRLDGANWSGSLSYSNINAEAPDLTQPDPAYWAHVDARLAYAESRGLLAFMFPAYVGYAGGSQGFMQELLANGPARVQAYGAWIAARYAGRANLVWMMGGDMGTGGQPFNAAQTAVEQALLTGLHSVPSQQSTLFSAEWNSDSIATDQTSFGTAMTLNGAYSWGGDVNYHCRRAYAHTPVEPAFLLEEPYDEEGPDGNGVNPSAIQPVRRFQWWGWLSSIGGYISGNGYVWPFNAGWQSHLNTQGAQDMARLNAFVAAIAWQGLVPSGLGGTATIVTAGGSTVQADDWVAASATRDGTLLVAYVPPAHTGAFSIDMTRFSGFARARWFDPTTATYIDIATSLPNTGTRAFTTPGTNSVGDSDWVLVIDLAAATRVFGSGCGQPALAAAPAPSSRPILGSTQRTDISNVPSALAFMAVGFSNTMLGSVPLPLALAGHGLPGCSLYHDAFQTALPCSNAGAGSAQHSLPIPNNLSLLYMKVYLQAWAPAPGANPGGILVSNAVELTLGGG